MTTPTATANPPRRLRPKLWMALLAAALSLLGGAQALAPTTAAAMDDLNATSECTEGMDSTFYDSADCADGSGGGGQSEDGGASSAGEPTVGEEIIEVSGTAPDSGSGVHPIGGPRPGPAGTGSDGQSKAGERVGGAHGSRSAPKKPAERPRFQWPHWTDNWHTWSKWEMCKGTYARILRFYKEERAISRGERGFLRWFVTGGIQTEEFERTIQSWEKDRCTDLYPVDPHL